MCTSCASFLFTSSTASTWHCWLTSSQHRVYIVPTSYILFTLSTTSQCWPTSCQSTLCTFFPVYIVVIVDITMLTNIKQTLCIHRVPSFMFISSTLPTLQCWSASCRHRVYIVTPISGLHRWHCRHRDVDSWPTSSRHCGHIVCLITLLRLFCTVAIKTLLLDAINFQSALSLLFFFLVWQIKKTAIKLKTLKFLNYCH